MGGSPVRVAVSGDLVGSRRTVDRAGLGRLIRRTLDGLADRFASEILAPPVLTRGIDEFSAAFRTSGVVFEFMVALNESLWPHRFRMGVGVGSIDIGGRTGNAARMDGPAFHLASRALADAREKGMPLVVRSDSAEPRTLDAVAALALSHATLVSEWTPGVARIVPALRKHGTQEATAVAIGTSQQAVSKAAHRGHLAVLRVIEAAGSGMLAGVTMRRVS